MERELLEQYTSKKEEIEELEYKLTHMNGDDYTESSVINDYRTGYPVPQTIVGVNSKKYTQTKDRYKRRLDKLRNECNQIEEFIESIDDSMTRRIFRMYFIDGESQKTIAKAVHLERSSISKKIDGFLKVSHNSQ